MDVNIQNKDGYALLHQLVFKNDENLCRWLLAHKADVNIQDNHGYTPLHWCAREGNENFSRLLLEHNADANIQDNNGYTTLHRAVMNGAVNLIGLWRSAARRKKRREAVRSHRYPSPSLLFFFSAHISLRCPHDLNSWNRLSRDKSSDQCSMSRNMQIIEQIDLQISSLFLAFRW